MKPAKTKIENLYLDPNNYRFIDHHLYKKTPVENSFDKTVQSNTLSIIKGKGNDGIKDLLDSIRENGFLPVDQVQAIKFEDDKYLVIEGNRRVAALKSIKEEHSKLKNSNVLGSLDPAIFEEFDFVVHDEADDYKHQIVMGLKHISGNKRWPAINQAQQIDDLVKKFNKSEQDVASSLGISLQRVRKQRRALRLIESYKKSEYGDQFNSTKYSIFEELSSKTKIRNWLNWDEKKEGDFDTVNLERLFSWISDEERVIYDNTNEEEYYERLPAIISNINDIRSLDRIIASEKDLQTMEDNRDVAYALSMSSIVSKDKLNGALNDISEKTKIIQATLDHASSKEYDQIDYIYRKFDEFNPLSSGYISFSERCLDHDYNQKSFFSRFFIKKYKGLQDLRLKNINRVNIFAGENNAGKTSFLESIYLLTKLNDSSGLFEVCKKRGKSTNKLRPNFVLSSVGSGYSVEGTYGEHDTKIEITPFESEGDINKSNYIKSIKISSSLKGIEHPQLVHFYSDKPNSLYHKNIRHLCRSCFTSPFGVNGDLLFQAHAYAVEHKLIGKIIKFIQSSINKDIVEIDLVEVDGEPRFSVDSSKFSTAQDLTSFGDGLQRIFEISLLIIFSRGGCVFIDEFEAGIHKSLLLKFTKYVQEIAYEFDVQLFISSHSKECIDAFIENEYRIQDITAFSLRNDTNITCKYISGEKLGKLIEVMNMDIRGGK